MKQMTVFVLLLLVQPGCSNSVKTGTSKSPSKSLSEKTGSKSKTRRKSQSDIVKTKKAKEKQHGGHVAVARDWKPIWVSPSAELHSCFKALLKSGFVMESDAGPGSPEKRVFSTIIPMTEPQAIILVAVDGGKFTAFAAGVYSKEEQHGTVILVPVFGGMFFMTGNVADDWAALVSSLVERSR